MPKRKKYPRLPNGYGQIRFIGKGRALPYAVHPPATERDETGKYIRPAAICYVPDWYTGFGVLSAYHSGLYQPGLEFEIAREAKASTANLDAFCSRIIRSQAFYKASECPTFGEVYKLFNEWKFGENAARKSSKSTVEAYSYGYKYLTKLKDRPIDQITVDELQRVVNDCNKKKATREQIVLVAKQIYKFAESRKICDNVAKYLILPEGRDDEHGKPFTEDELKILAEHKDNVDVQTILIMCYSGFRIGALATLEVNTDEWYFKGGIKTNSSKNRIVPIHSGIQEFFPHVFIHPQQIRKRMNAIMTEYGMKHTPHDCRHTFSMLCEKYGVREADRKRMMGHAFGNDLTNSIYGHRTLEDLRVEIEKIKFVGSCGD